MILCLMKCFYICGSLPIESANLLLKEATSLPPPFSLSLSIPLSLSFSLSLYLSIYLSISLSLSLSVTLSLILSMHSCLRICTHLNLINCLSSLSLSFPLSPYSLPLLHSIILSHSHPPSSSLSPCSSNSTPPHSFSPLSPFPCQICVALPALQAEGHSGLVLERIAARTNSTVRLQRSFETA